MIQNIGAKAHQMNKNKVKSCSHDNRITKISWVDDYSISECKNCGVIWDEETGKVIKWP